MSGGVRIKKKQQTGIEHVHEPKTEPDHDSIDAVYTWIDASDEKRYMQRERFIRQVSACESERRLPVNFIDGDSRHTELYYSLHSLRVFAPWIRTVWIVTHENHVPSFMCEFPRAKVVHHGSIFKNASNLPTFSSRAIESNIHRIKGLAEKFIYINDDMFLGQHLTPDDFFVGGKPVLRTVKTWKPLMRSHASQSIRMKYNEEYQTVPSVKDNAYVNSNKHVHSWLNTYYVLDPLRTNIAHQATPLTVTIMKQAELELSDEWVMMEEYRLRSSDTMTPIPLALFVGFYNGRAVVLPKSKDRVKKIWGTVNNADLIIRVLRERPHMFCLNDIGPHLEDSVVRICWKGLHRIIKEAQDAQQQRMKT